MQQVKKEPMRCAARPCAVKGRVIDAAADVDPGRLHLCGPEHADKDELFSNVQSAGCRLASPLKKAGHS